MKIVKIIAAAIVVVMLGSSFMGCVKKVEDTRPSLNIELRVYSDIVNIKSGEGKDELFLNPAVFSPTDYKFKYESGSEPTLMDVFKDVFDNHPSGKASYTLKVDGTLNTVSIATKTHKESQYVNKDGFIVLVLWAWDLNGIEMDKSIDEYKVKDGDFIRFYFSELVTEEKADIPDETEADEETQAEID